ncbi:MAG: FAD-dependent oxidoreductase, partial [Spirochaetaceae bacterium]|nr:FAD-dependent oxidoreductase [Spirochaetaceae bacterium]
ESAALASSRVTVTCMGMGQAAGTAAALSASSGLGSRELDITQIQQQLLADGAIIGHRADDVRAVGDAMRPEEMPSAAASH